jgi:hypothetical protein
MSTTLRDFIANRKGEIRDQLKMLKTELKELLLAEAALDGQDGTPAVAQSGGGPTIKDMARFVLNHDVAKEGLTSAEILGYIKEEYGREIDRTSLSPQLSRLKDAGEVALLGEKWFSKEHYDAWVKSLAIFPDDDDDQQEDEYEVVIVDDDDL